MTQPPIADYALVSDCRSAALVSRGGSVDWLCYPRFDGPSVFARILDERAGHWSIRPAGDATTERRYLDNALVLETTFRTPTGTVVLTDAMATGPNPGGHDLGMRAPAMFVRTLRCTDGQVAIHAEWAPRPEYGRIFPRLSESGGVILAKGGANVMSLSSSVPTAIEDSAAVARFALRGGEEATFALHHRMTWEEPPGRFDAEDVHALLGETVEAWRSWSGQHQSYDGPWSDLVMHSGRVLQALTWAPTGAIVAAPTTSLPEELGGERNWDYRYTWVRDASFTLEALWVAACPDEAYRFFDWMSTAVAEQLGRGSDLQIMFGIGGEHDLSERELNHLSGYRGSRPVRIGNGAWDQRQLDVYGELLGAAQRLSDRLEGADAGTRRFFVEVADAAAARWREQDQGIWEVRGEPRDFVYSKLMCWAALDRALALAGAGQLDAGDRVETWTEVREEIREAILDQGWSDAAGAFTRSFGSEDLDASNLMMPIVGFLPGDDPRMKATIDAIAERLTDERGLVFRYRAADGLAGEEGTFLLCTFWLAHALAVAGEIERAKETFERAVAFVNDVGLLAEEVDAATGELLGNFPQAFSHIGLINAAWAIHLAETNLEAARAARAPGDATRSA